MKRLQYIIAGVIALLFFSATKLATLYVDFAWFAHYEKVHTFWTLFFAKFNVQLLFTSIFLVLFLLNLLYLRFFVKNGRFSSMSFVQSLPFFNTHRHLLYLTFAAAIVSFSFLMGGAARSFWSEILLYFNRIPFDGFPSDPVFGKNISFFVFSLPFYNFLYGWTIGTLIAIFIFSVVFHIINGGIVASQGKIKLSPASRSHLSFLTALLLFLFASGFYLAQFELLFSQRGKFYGAGFTALHSQLLAYRVCLVLSIIAGLILLVNFFRKSFLLAVGVVGTTIVLYFILTSIVPAFQQRFIVEPNELEKEKPYITNNIAFTRVAYGIDQVETKMFANDGELSKQDLADYETTINNIRLWDWRPLKQTYRQLQELKPYYHFNDVDIDRYEIDGEVNAINLSARELLTSKLSQNSKTWINTHLVYTHGYGFVANRVDQITKEGLPEMIVKDIPPKSDSIVVKRPEIYFGEHDNDYIITNTKINPGEFDYPSGETNKYTTYEGNGGVALNSVLKRLAFAITFNDINILISSNITNESRIHYRRNIREMTAAIAPYLMIDKDPYLVAANGRLYYIIDAYTLSDDFPYSTPVAINRRQVNYIKNSVKVVIDAYNGDITHYISDNDPLVKAYAKLFHDTFKDISEMPDELRSHIRYPETLFDVQSHVLLRYHMTNVNVFYNNEDAWEIPRQIYDSSEEQMDSYYIITRLPDEEKTEFVLMIPFTPFKKDNMLSFLVAKCDGDEYGKLVLYKLPKEKLSYGPMQLEARINQDPEISKQLTLWSQKGSRVIRGNMLAIPIKNSLLFVEPLYLKAETSEMPELKRVIVSFKDQIVMEENLTKALTKVFAYTELDLDSQEEDEDSALAITPLKGSLQELVSNANQIYSEAEAALKEGNFAAYGSKIKQLKTVLKALEEMSKDE